MVYYFVTITVELSAAADIECLRRFISDWEVRQVSFA